MSGITKDSDAKPDIKSVATNLRDFGRDIKVLVLGGLAVLGMGEAGIITADFKGAPNLADSKFRVDRRAELRLNAEAFPVEGFSAYLNKMEKDDSELKERVFTLNGHKEGEDKFVFKGAEASPLCKDSIIEVRTNVNDFNIDLEVSALGNRLGGLTIKGIPSFASVGIGLFVKGESNRKVGCDVLVSDGKTENILVVRYKDDGHIVIDGSPAFTSHVNP